MLNGFEEITAPLTEHEKTILPVIVSGLKRKVGVHNSVTNKAICEGLKRVKNIDINEARVRKIINHIRMHNLVPGLIANSKGYYISNNPKEVKAYIESLEGRKQAIEGITKQFKQYLFQITTQQQKQLFINK